jgi:Spy/CpxP family protein refolding chaperone
MEINQTSQPQPSNPTMKNQLAKLLPLLTILFAVPAFASTSTYFNHNTRQGRIADGGMGKRADRLNLTPDQKTKMQQLRAATRSQIEAVLTPQQRQQLAQVKAQRQANRQDGKGMNLTADQKTQLKAIRETNQQQFKAMLTPAQQAQLAQGGRGWGKGGAMARLNLTPDQTAKMQQLRAAARSQMNAVLTPAQQQQAQARYEQRQAMGNTWKSLNLTPSQQAKITSIRQASEQQLNTILTPEQQSQRKSPQHGGRRKSV